MQLLRGELGLSRVALIARVHALLAHAAVQGVSRTAARTTATAAVSVIVHRSVASTTRIQFRHISQRCKQLAVFQVLHIIALKQLIRSRVLHTVYAAPVRTVRTQHYVAQAEGGRGLSMHRLGIDGAGLRERASIDA